MMNKEIKERIETINKGNVPTGLIKNEIGLLPVDWATVTLNDIADALTQTAGKESYETVSISAGVGFVNQAKKFGKELSGKQYEKYIVLHKGDFSYNKGNSKTYPQGCIYRLKDRETAAVPNVFESFRLKSGCADYYEQLFTSGFLNKQFARKINHGVRDDGLLNLTGKDFYSCLLPLPPVKEQEKIAEILSRCDTVIEECKKQMEEYKSLKKTCLNKMFPKKGSNTPEIRFPGFTDAWEQRKLSEMCGTFEYGLNAAAKEFDGKNKYIRITDIDDASREFLISDLSSPDICLDGMSKYLLSSGDIVFARTGASVGKTYIYRENDGIVYFAGFLIRAKVNQDNDAEFVFQSTLSPSYEKYIRITSQRSGQPGVNAQEYGEYDLFAPSKEEQQRIGHFLRGIDNLITLHQRKADAYTQMKKALTQLLLTGIVRVNKQKEILP